MHARNLCSLVALWSVFLAGARVWAQEPSPPVATAQGAVTPPKLKTDPGVRYPDQALKDRFYETVTVVVVLEVDVTGVVRKATIDAPLGHGFDEEATAAARQLVFEPARRDGAPIAARFRFRYVFRPPAARLVGRVADQATNAPLAGVDVVIRTADGVDHATKTAADGTWSLRDVPAGAVHVSASLPDRGSQSADETLAPGEETSVVLRLADIPKVDASAADAGGPPPLEVSVKGDRPPREVTKRTLLKEEIDLIPGTRGDALLSLQSLPGVARPPPFSGQLIVRGSAPQDTGIFVDGTQVPLVYHFGGLSSVIPAELLNKIDFYPGNFSAVYGRGMGGIVDVGIRDPKKDGYHGMAQLDLIDARLLVEGPIGGGWSFLAAGRRSWFDLWLGPILQSTGAGVTTAPRYYDYQAVIHKDINPRSSFRLMFFGSDDALAIEGESPSASNPTFGGDFGSHTSFWRLQARYQNKITDDTRLSVLASVGQDSVDVGLGSSFYNTSETPISGRAELSQKVTRGVEANVGLDIQYSPYHLDVRFPAPTRPGVPSGGPLSVPIESTGSGARFFPGMYTEWELTPAVGTRIVPGVRVDYSSSTKTWDVSPRINFRQDLTRDFPRTTIKGGVGLFYQPPQPLETDPVFGQPGLKSNRSVQADVGVEQELTRSIDLTVDAYYKYLDQLVVAGAKNDGKGTAYGVEWLLKYKADDRFFGWISYALSRSERQDVAQDPWYLFAYDQTHVLTVLGSYAIGAGWRVGGRFRLVSGNPYTPSTEGIYNATAGVVQAAPTSPQNSSRLPAFHQLDLRVDKVWAFKHWKLTTYLDIQNVYDHQSAEGVSYNYNYTRSTIVGGLPILPSIGLRGEL